MKQEVFGMRRANGDWFVLEVAGQSRVLLFGSLMEAWRARAKNDQLMLYWPAPLDAGALAQFATGDNGRPATFWLVDEDDADAVLDRGRPLEYMQLCTLERLYEFPPKPKSREVEDRTSQNPPVDSVTQGGEPINEVRNRLLL